MSLLSYLGTCTFHTGQNSVIFTKENPLFLVYNLNPNAPKIIGIQLWIEVHYHIIYISYIKLVLHV